MEKSKASPAWVLGVLLLAPGGGFAADRYVANTGGVDSANDCTSAAAPCKSIEHALGVAGSGDTVNLTGGTYHAALRFDTSTSLTVLGGWDLAFTTRDPEANPSIIRAKSRRYPNRSKDHRPCRIVAGAGTTITLEFDGIVLTRGKATFRNGPDVLGDLHGLHCCPGGAGLWVLAHGGTVTLTMRRGAIRDNRNKAADTLQGGGVYAEAVFDGVANLTFDRMLFSGNRANYAGAMVLVGGSGTTTVDVVNSIVTGQRNEGAQAAYVVTNEGPGNPPVLNLRNSTITGNEGDEEGAVVLFGGAVNASNTILFGNSLKPGSPGTAADLEAQSGHATLDHCDIGDVSGTYVDGGGNLSVDPGLDTQLELMAGSPMIDAGTCRCPQDRLRGRSASERRHVRHWGGRVPVLSAIGFRHRDYSTPEWLSPRCRFHVKPDGGACPLPSPKLPRVGRPAPSPSFLSG
jgi:hypothetical protein